MPITVTVLGPSVAPGKISIGTASEPSGCDIVGPGCPSAAPLTRMPGPKFAVLPLGNVVFCGATMTWSEDANGALSGVTVNVAGGVMVKLTWSLESSGLTRDTLTLYSPAAPAGTVKLIERTGLLVVGIWPGAVSVAPANCGVNVTTTSAASRPGVKPLPDTAAELPGGAEGGVALIRSIVCAYADMGTSPPANNATKPRLRAAREVMDERVELAKVLRVRKKGN
jgi:hypothetical protein